MRLEADSIGVFRKQSGETCRQQVHKQVVKGGGRDVPSNTQP